MAQYTIELGKLIENNWDIGLKEYPVYKEEIRERLNKKIIEHFYFREIGLETPELFKRFLNRKMEEIMPYYNQLYKSEDLEYNPLYNIELTETFTHKQDLTAKSESNSTDTTNYDSTKEGTLNENANDKGESLNINSDTPDTGVSIDQIKSGVYASKSDYNSGSNSSDKNTTSKDKDISKTSNTGNTDVNSQQGIEEEYTKKTEGSSAGLSFSRAIEQWRKVMINIDMMIIKELEPLFMGIW